MLGELGDEVQRVERLHILLEILGIDGVEEYPRLEWLVPDFLQRKRRSRHVFCEVLPRLIVENPDAIVDAEAGMSPR